METFIKLSEEDRRTYFTEAASRLGILPIIVEKDFWVCWTLKTLYSIPSIAKHITFKGGTSLSKAHGGLIQRFSEDIDLVIDKSEALKGVLDAAEQGISGKERERRIKALRTESQRYIKETILPQFNKKCSQLLEPGSWSTEHDPDDKDQQTILFHFPRVLSYSTNSNLMTMGVGGSTPTYIRPRVKLEFGAKGGKEPSAPKIITPYVSEFIDEMSPGLLQNPECVVPTLSAERTFWEKVTILHALYHKQKINPYMSRHYYDVCLLDRAGVSQSAMTDHNLLEQVVKNKDLYFSDKHASYDTAKLGSMKLTPPEAIIVDLRNDYKKMSDEMLMGNVPDFDTIIRELGILEGKINNGN